jgi:hypothetical protein
MKKSALAILSIPLLYFLSIGPAAWLLNSGVAPERVGSVVYWPIEKMYRESPEARKVIDWYVGPFRKPVQHFRPGCGPTTRFRG